METGGKRRNWRMRQGQVLLLQVLGSDRDNVMAPLQDFKQLISLFTVLWRMGMGQVDQLSDSPWLGYGILEAWVGQGCLPTTPLKKKKKTSVKKLILVKYTCNKICYLNDFYMLQFSSIKYVHIIGQSWNSVCSGSRSIIHYTEWLKRPLTYIFTVLESWKSKIMVPEHSVPGDDPLPGVRLLSPYRAERDREHNRVSSDPLPPLIKILIPLWGLTFMTSFKLDYLQRPHLQILSHWGVMASSYEYYNSIYIFCVWFISLSIMSLRFMHSVAYASISFP